MGVTLNVLEGKGSMRFFIGSRGVKPIETANDMLIELANTIKKSGS